MNNPTDDDPALDPGPLDAATNRVLTRAHQLAQSPLEGIEDAAKELAQLAGTDHRVIEQTYRITTRRARALPTRTNKQIASLIRRALEIGTPTWNWPTTRPSPNGGSTSRMRGSFRARQPVSWRV